MPAAALRWAPRAGLLALPVWECQRSKPTRACSQAFGAGCRDRWTSACKALGDVRPSLGLKAAGIGKLRTLRTQIALANLSRKERRPNLHDSPRSATCPGRPQAGVGNLAPVPRTWFDTYPGRAATPSQSPQIHSKPARSRQRRTARDERPRSRHPRSAAAGFVVNTKGPRCVRTGLTRGRGTMRPDGLFKLDLMPSSVRQRSRRCPRHRTSWCFTWAMSAFLMRCRGGEARSTSRGHPQCRACRGQRHPRRVGCDRSIGAKRWLGR
jgi:hypothetical protein